MGEPRTWSVVAREPVTSGIAKRVNYVFDKPSQSILIRSEDGTKLHSLIRSAKAAFEVDDADPFGRIGWSVIIYGVGEEITNPCELRRIEALGLEPWAPGHKGHWIRIRANTVSGRQIVGDSHGPNES